MAGRLTALAGAAAPERGRVALRIALIYLAARAVTTGFFLSASALSPHGSRFGPDAGLGAYVLAWDAQWYWLIAVEGYPAELPRTDQGEVAQNAWAFMPVFPVLARMVGAPFGAWGAGAFAVSLAAGYLCALVLRDVLRERIGDTAAMWAVVFFVAAPLSPLFQVGYAESLFLLLLLWGIRCVQRRRFAWLYAIVPVMGFTRPGVLAFALFLALFGLWRLSTRTREPLHRTEVIHILALGALASVVGFAWQVIAAAVTGQADAYLETELAWRRLWVGDEGGFVPFEGWFQAAEFWFGQWGAAPGVGIAAAVAIVLAVAALLLFEPHVRRLGAENRLWAAAYVVYLLAVFFPQSSIFRLLLPLSALWGALASPPSRIWRLGILCACLLGQWWWVWNMYGLGSAFWQIP